MSWGGADDAERPSYRVIERQERDDDLTVIAEYVEHGPKPDDQLFLWQEDGAWYYTNSKTDAPADAWPAASRCWNDSVDYYRVDGGEAGLLFLRDKATEAKTILIDVGIAEPIRVRKPQWREMWSIGFTSFCDGGYYNPTVVLHRHKEGRQLLHVQANKYEARSGRFGEFVPTGTSEWEPILRRLALRANMDLSQELMTAFQRATTSL
jgi:hypothetical protein